MSRQAEFDQRVRDAGGKRITVTLQPATVAALRELRARGAVSDAAAVNSAVIDSARFGEPSDREHDIIFAFMAGAKAVHDHYEPDMNPDFKEAAHDYAASVRR